MKAISVWAASQRWADVKGYRATHVSMNKYYALELIMKDKWVDLDRAEKMLPHLIVYGMKVEIGEFSNYYHLEFRGEASNVTVDSDPHLEQFLKNMEEEEAW